MDSLFQSNPRALDSSSITEHTKWASVLIYLFHICSSSEAFKNELGDSKLNISRKLARAQTQTSDDLDFGHSSSCGVCEKLHFNGIDDEKEPRALKISRRDRMDGWKTGLCSLRWSPTKRGRQNCTPQFTLKPLWSYRTWKTKRPII